MATLPNILYCSQVYWLCKATNSDTAPKHYNRAGRDPDLIHSHHITFQHRIKCKEMLHTTTHVPITQSHTTLHRMTSHLISTCTINTYFNLPGFVTWPVRYPVPAYWAYFFWQLRLSAEFHWPGKQKGRTTFFLKTMLFHPLFLSFNWTLTSIFKNLISSSLALKSTSPLRIIVSVGNERQF